MIRKSRMTVLSRVVPRRLSLIVAHIPIGAMLEQEVDHLLLAVVAGDQDGRRAMTPASNQAGPGGKHGLRLPELATADSDDECLFLIHRGVFSHVFTPSGVSVFQPLRHLRGPGLIRP